MAYWLLKSEPDEFGWADMCQRGAAGEAWTGVRNHQAKNQLDAMEVGDRAFFYHTGLERQIVGIVQVIAPSFPDPTDGAWRAVTVAANAAVVQPVSLAMLKASSGAIKELEGLALLKNPRLSVQPVTEAQWIAILTLAKGSTDITIR
jgi:predicted RNA-binding protein with PUA-like domain